MRVSLYTQPGCKACNDTEALLKQNGVDIIKHDVRENATAFQFVVDQGFKATPVIHTDDGDVWAGHNPQMIEDYVRRNK